MTKCNTPDCFELSSYIYLPKMDDIVIKHFKCSNHRIQNIDFYNRWKELTIEEYEVKMVLES